VVQVMTQTGNQQSFALKKIIKGRDVQNKETGYQETCSLRSYGC
jgi:hypothetical protein